MLRTLWRWMFGESGMIHTHKLPDDFPTDAGDYVLFKNKWHNVSELDGVIGLPMLQIRPVSNHGGFDTMEAES